ncbi:MFS transporter [Salinarimonas sp.]|uniref:MFS transporter n=1 Tax=Salinarimonas sp. TaxID=2766526 RepID=UPI00391BF5FD
MTARIALFYYAVFLSAGVYNTIFPVWLHERGLSLAEVSLVLSVPIAVKLLVDPLMGALADRTGWRKRLVVGLVAATALCNALFALAHTFPQILGVALLSGLFWSAVMPLGDSIVSRRLALTPVPYGRARSFGSLSKLTTSAIAGAVAVVLADAAIVLLVACYVVALMVVSLALPADDVHTPGKPRSSAASPHPLDADPPRAALLVMLAVALVLGAHALLYAVGSLYWTSLGFSSTTIALFWAAALLAEIVVFLLSDRAGLRRIAPATLVAIGAIAGIVRWLGLTVATDPIAIAGLQALQGATLAGVNVALMRYVTEKVSPLMASRTFGRVAAISHGLVPLSVTIVAGPLLAGIGAAVFGLGAVLCATALAMVAIAVRIAARAKPARTVSAA